MLHSHSSASLSIHVSSATELVSAQTFGKQDPYLQFSLDYNQKDTFLKTFTHKNAGENATWNQTFTMSLNGEENLYVEVLDEESTVNEVIGFAAIPINQVVHAQGANMNGLFEIYNVKGERAGLLNLHLAALGFPNSQTPNFDCEPVRGQSFLHEGHCVRMKSTKNKATGVAVGGAILGGALAIGAGFLGKKLYDNHQEAEREEEEQQRLREEEETRRREEDEKRQHEREEFDQERARYESERSEFEREKANREKEDCERKEKEDCHRKEKKKDDCHRKEKEDCDRDSNKHHRRRNSNSSDDDDDAKKWNPVGTYAAGDRVKYHGQVYVCLQGHTSNPTWQPGAAHSLWQAE